MYQYKFIKLLIGDFIDDDNRHQIINQEAQEGWRFVQVYPIEYGGGEPISYEMVFERKL